MTIQPKRGSFTVHCDSCPEYFEIDSLDFNRLVKTARLKGWKIYKGKYEIWTHKCPACQEG